jgi:capsule polysaccharide export protein KpsE/RkpR
LASLGGLAGLAGGLARTPADQYVALMQSVTVSDRLIDKYKLIEAYDKKLRVDARAELDKRVRMVVGKKDGLITIEVEDENPARAAQIADQFVAELRTLTSTLSVTEAQQRRAFFERELKRARDGLTQAQTVLQASGFSQGALKAEPKIAADNYARLRAQVVAAQVRLQTLQSQLADKSPEVREQQTLLSALQSELARSERATDQAGGPDYVSKYREFKYQETLFELFARQYEVARVDESREGALIQVVDPATVPEKKSRPKRLLLSASAGLLTLLLVAGVLVVRHVRRLRRGAVRVPADATA